MNKPRLQICIAILSLMPQLHLQAQDTIKDVQWLKGSWKRTNANTNMSWEIWQQHEDGLSGIGFTLNKGDTTFIEKLSIILNNDGLFYIADVPHNLAPTYFKLTHHKNDSWTFENPDHDFPKIITYRRISTSTMNCTIQGNGKQIIFEFKKEEH